MMKAKEHQRKKVTMDYNVCVNKLGIREYSPHSWHQISRHTEYVDVFVKSRILSLYILYTFIPYMSTFVSRHVAYLDMFLGPKRCFHALI